MFETITLVREASATDSQKAPACSARGALTVRFAHRSSRPRPPFGRPRARCAPRSRCSLWCLRRPPSPSPRPLSVPPNSHRRPTLPRVACPRTSVLGTRSRPYCGVRCRGVHAAAASREGRGAQAKPSTAGGWGGVRLRSGGTERGRPPRSLPGDASASAASGGQRVAARAAIASRTVSRGKHRSEARSAASPGGSSGRGLSCGLRSRTRVALNP